MHVQAFAFLLVVTAASADAVRTAVPVSVPGGSGGVGFDDLGFSTALRRVLVPGGRTGNLDLVDPATHTITTIAGFSTDSRYGGGHDQGATSADAGGGLLFATDRSNRLLEVVDPGRLAIVASVHLSAAPDYVRFVAPGEVWVTEPGAEQIELFSTRKYGTPPERMGSVKVPGGPESLVIDASRGRAYAHLWKGETVAIDLRTHAVTARWKNGCEESRGIALDEQHALLFAGCDEGKATAMDLRREGAIVSTARTGAGVDVIAWSPKLRHLYAPGGDSANLTVLAVGAEGSMRVVATIPTAKGAHCVAADDTDGAWICDPRGGRLLFFADSAR